VADLGAVRGFAYYTGTIFHVYAPGTGDAVASGGRYDELLARFDRPMPAAGFALDLDRLTEALHDARSGARPLADGAPRVVVVGSSDDPRVVDLRARGVVAVAAGVGTGRAEALAWARAWGFSHVLERDIERNTDQWVDAATGGSIRSPFGERGER
jgi:ATP phosphoribosyltransferase regulatory subunit